MIRVELGEKYYNTIVRISKVDCTKSGAICEQLEVRGYPTLLFFHDGKMVRQYDRARSIEQFSLFIEELVEIYEPSAISDDPQQHDQEQVELHENILNSQEQEQQEQPASKKLVDMPGELAELDDDTFTKFIARKGITFIVGFCFRLSYFIFKSWFY